MTGLDLEISGALGKRTTFQTKDTSQLIVRASSTTEDSAQQDVKTQPKQVDQEHELLLKAPLFVEEQNHGRSLSLVDQTLMLALL